MGKQSLLKGTIILAVAACYSKLIGFINGIVLSRLLGPEGIGLAMMAMPVTGLLIAVTGFGLEVAVANLVAENNATNNRTRLRHVLSVSFLITGTLSIFTSLLLLGVVHFAPGILFADERAIYTFTAIIPIIPIVAISSILKGYFHGKQYMSPGAFASILEQSVQLVVTYMLVQYLLPYGLGVAAAGAVISMIIGEAISLGVLMIAFNKQKEFKWRFLHIIGDLLRDGRQHTRDLIRVALPNTGSHLVNSFAGVLLPIIITHSFLTAGLTAETATETYGLLMGYVMPLVFVPTFITHSLSTNLLPSISDLYARRQFQEMYSNINQVINVTMMICIPWALFLYFFATDLTGLFYHSEEAGLLIQKMIFCFMLSYLQIPLQAVLIGIGKSSVVLYNNLIAALASLLMIYFVASQPSMGVNGVILGMNLGEVLGTVLHFASLYQAVRFPFSFARFYKLLLAITCMASCAIFLYMTLDSYISNGYVLLSSVLVISAVFYLLLLHRFRLFKQEQ
ncbi:stage V sporulation protein B [Terribacillus sp. FSL K6-0262]|uniref:stage V sporulation protein B n=1 Tax=Terribacillus sp. FSL K6-0262 TaxID=2921447 RepID=UPI0030EBC091